MLSYTYYVILHVLLTDSLTMPNCVYTCLYLYRTYTLHASLGKWLACQSMDNKVMIYGVHNNFRLNRKKSFRGHMVAGYACQVDFSPDGRYYHINTLTHTYTLSTHTHTHTHTHSIHVQHTYTHMHAHTHTHARTHTHAHTEASL